MQLVGHGLVLRANEGGLVSDEAFDEAIGAAGREFENDVCETTLAALSDMVVDGEQSTTAGVAERLGVTTDYAQKYRKRLIDAGVIESAGWGRIRICVPLLADYLRGER